MRHPFHYVSIPCLDLTRASDFYTAVTGLAVVVNEHVPFPMAYIVDEEGNYPGHLFVMEGYRPSPDGPVVYLEVDHDLDLALRRVEAAGGRTLRPKQSIGPGKGFWAEFIDSEGNRLALHSDQ